MAIQHLPYQPFALSVSHLHFGRHMAAEFHDLAVEKRHARLETDRHRRAIHLLQDIVRQVAQRIGKRDSVEIIDRPVDRRHLLCEPAFNFIAARNHPPRIVVYRTQQAIGVIGSLRVENARDFYKLVARAPNPVTIRNEPSAEIANLIGRLRRNGTDQTCKRPLHGRRHQSEARGQAGAPDVPVIPAEQLIARVAGKRDRDAAPRQRRDQMSGYL